MGGGIESSAYGPRFGLGLRILPRAGEGLSGTGHFGSEHFGTDPNTFLGVIWISRHVSARLLQVLVGGQHVSLVVVRMSALGKG
jgi:hypothetical protein